MNEDDQEEMLIVLIRALRDYRNPDVGGTDDAAMNLSAFDDPRAEQALLQVARESDADETILDSCGESLAEIWIRKGDVSRAKLDSLSYAAKKSAERYILGVAPARFPGAPESPMAEQVSAPNDR